MAIFRIDSPTEGQKFYKAPSEDLSITVSGYAEGKYRDDPLRGGNSEEISNIRVKFGGGDKVKATQEFEEDERRSHWTAEKVKTNDSGANVEILVTYTVTTKKWDSRGNIIGGGHYDTSQTRTVEVEIDSSPPTLDIISPIQNSTIDILESGTSIEVKVLTRDAELGVHKVVCELDGKEYTAERQERNTAEWEAIVSVSVPPNALGNKSIAVSSEDWAGNRSSPKPLTFTGKDITPPYPPNVRINSPLDGYEHPKGEDLIVRGVASDVQSGISALEWRLDNESFTPVPLPWNNWSFVIEAARLTPGPHSLEIRAQDGAGKWSNRHPDLILNFEVSDVYVPQDASDLVSLPAYLLDLLWFSRGRINKNYPNVDTQLKDADLESLFYQPFGRLGDVRTMRASEPVNQMRPCIEVLRRFLVVGNMSNPPTHLLAHWRFDEGKGDTLTDATGNGNMGTRNGASWSTGRVGSTLLFNGTTDCVLIHGSDRLRALINNFSIVFWAYPKGNQSQQYVVYPSSGSMFGSPDHVCVGIAVGTNDVSVYEYSGAPTTPDLVCSLGQERQLRSWTHIAVVYRDKAANIYLNGKLVRSGLKSSKTYVHAFTEAIGGGDYGHYSGYLDDVRIYDGPLTDVEISALASARIPSDHSLPDAVTENDYRLAAYQSLLNRIGTSYEELRLARKMDPAQKEKIADRLGLPFGASVDPVDALLLSPEAITEIELERLFGFVDTTRDPLADTPQRESQLMTWRRAHLRVLWYAEDAETYDVENTRRPIIDPDIIAESDLSLPQPGNLAFDLWQHRSKLLDGKYKDLKEKRESQATAKDGFAQVLSAALEDQASKFQELDEKERAGNDIEAERARLGFTESAFRRLLRIRDLAQAETVIDNEWVDAYHILVQAWKNRQFPSWRSEETTPGQEVMLSPGFFKIGSLVPNVPWRSLIEVRLAWEERLQARIDQERTLREALLADILAVEERTLPLLRDALVGSFARRLGLHPDDTADYLTARLFVDARSKGTLCTTRLQQAIETLQSFLEALRRRQLLESHSAASWELAFLDTDPATGGPIVRKIDNDVFATEWKYMGAYDAWRGAMSVFFFPENLLLPSLRVDASSDFSAAVKSLRAKRRITEKDLDDAIKKAGLYEDEQEYYMPLELALRLQATGDYLRALDWFRKVYPYDKPLAERKIGGGLFDRERNDAPILQRTHDWIFRQDPQQTKTDREELNPHRIARLRNGMLLPNAKAISNPYTRYTLMAVARCFIDYADAEFASEAPESIGHARNLYLSARTLLSLPELDPPSPNRSDAVVYPNHFLEGLRRRVEVQLTKLREGRNIAGLKRQVEAPVTRPLDSSLATIGMGGQLIIPGVRSFLRPTPYRYHVLIERSKQLVNVAQQVEANYLAALEKLDKETYDLLQAKFGLQLANESVELQRRRHDGVKKEFDLADLQRKRVTILQDAYSKRLNVGLNRYERQVLGGYAKIRTLKVDLEDLEANAGIYDAYLGYTQGGVTGGPIGALFGAIKGALSVGKILDESALKLSLNQAEFSVSLSEKMANFERQKDEWLLQKSLADQDALIADKQIDIARQHEQVSLQELRISGLQAAQAEATATFLATKFTNADLYDWMSRVLREVYSYFLQQAAAIAQLAQNQLAFERQEVPPAFIQADYWQMPPEDKDAADSQAPDRQGLTGSARLLQDTYKLDQYAFETDKRKLNLSQTFSIASLFPYEFALFQESGVLTFTTPMQLFDKDFPGHYLRLIKRVKMSIIALIPPNRGIRATLRAVGISRVVVGGDFFQEITINRNPELVALTSPMNASGVFELDSQSDMLLPFEGMGVGTNWELELPKPANPFHFGTIVDVLFTLDYTALHSDEYRRQVIRRLPRKVSADLSISIRNQFPDTWYDLANPEQLEMQKQMVVNFETQRGDFPPNFDGSRIIIQQLVLAFIPKGGNPRKEIPITSLSFKGIDGQVIGGGATTIDGLISTRGGSATDWRIIIGKSPFGEWQLKLPNTDEMKQRFKDEDIKDILFIITYSGRTPQWPV